MPSVRATLTQDIVELQNALRPFLNRVLENYCSPAVTYESTLTWILAEEIESIHWLFDQHHQLVRHQDPYIGIYRELRSSLPIDLSCYVSHYVAVPRLYADHNLIDLRIEGLDLHLDYYRDPYAPMPQIVKY